MRHPLCILKQRAGPRFAALRHGGVMSEFVVGDVLEHDHHEIDAGFADARAGFAAGEWRRESFDRSAEALRHHIYVEEEVLFPFLRNGGLVAPVFVMHREHAEIWQGLAAVEAAFGTDAAGAAAAMDAMAAVLDAHNSKEEQILYPASGSVLAPADTEAVRAAFEESRRPDGWLPTNLRR